MKIDPFSKMDDKGNLYRTVIKICFDATEAGNEVQEQVNDELTKLGVIEQYPLVLVDVIINDNEDYDVRHLASIFLKNHLEDVMMTRRQNESPTLNNKTGNTILIQLLSNLDCLQEKRLLEMVASILSSLACLGHWEHLSRRLSKMAVNVRNPKEIGDAMLILNIAFSEKYLTHPNFPAIERHWFMLMLGVLQMKHIPSLTRELTINPMFQMLKSVKDHRDFILDNLQRLAEVFESVLNEPCSEACRFSLKIEIFDIILEFLKIFGDDTNIFIPPLLPVFGILLMNCCEQFKSYLNGAAKAITDPDEQEPELYYALVDKLLLFLSKLIDMPYFDILLESLENVIYCVIVFMSCHGDMSDNLFQDQIERIGFSWVLRTSSADTLMNLVDKLSLRQPTGKSTFHKSLVNVFTRLCLESSPDNADRNKVFYFNRITESMAYTLGLLSNKFSIDDIDFLRYVDSYLLLWTDYLYRCEPMLLGRILLVGGQYCQQIRLHCLQAHVNFILEYFREMPQSEYLLMPCADALACYMENFHAMTLDRQRLLISVKDNIIKSIIYLSTSNIYPMQQTLVCLTHALQLEKNILEVYRSDIERILIEAVRHNGYSPVINALNWTVSKLAQSTTFGPDYEFPVFLYNRLDRGLSHAHNFNLEHVLEVLNTLLVFSPESLNGTYVLQVFTRSFHAMQLLDEDLEVLEASAQLLVTCLVKFHKVLVGYRYHNEDKQYAAIFELPTIFEKLLQYNLFVKNTMFGRLINFAMLRIPEVIEPYYENIIRNVVTSFGNANLREHNMKLITNWSVFIHFLMIRPAETIKFLSLLPGPNHGSALEHVLFMFEPSHLPHCDYIDRRLIVFSIIGLLKKILGDEEIFQIFRNVSVELEDHQAICSVNGLTYLYSLLVNCLLFEHNLKYPRLPLPFQSDIPENLRSQADYCLYDRDFEPLIFETEAYILNFLGPLDAICYSAIVHTIHEGHYENLRMLGLAVPEGTNRCNMRCCTETME